MSIKASRGSKCCLPICFDPISLEESCKFVQARWGAVLGEDERTCIVNDSNVRALVVRHEQIRVSCTRSEGAERRVNFTSCAHVCCGFLRCILVISPLAYSSRFIYTCMIVTAGVLTHDKEKTTQVRAVDMLASASELIFHAEKTRSPPLSSMLFSAQVY